MTSLRLVRADATLFPEANLHRAAPGSVRDLTSYKTQWRAYASVFGLITVYLAVARHWQGISFYDDSLYLSIGRTFRLSQFWTLASYAPLYCLWIKLVSLFFHDPVWCYMASWVLLVILVSSIPVWLGIRWAWAYTLVLIATPLFAIVPYVSLFASLFLVAGICLVLRRIMSLSDAICAACIVCFLTAFSRPEFEYGLYIANLTLVPAIFLDDRQRPYTRNTRRSLAGKFLLAAGLALGLHVIMHGHPSVRSGVAFEQHYNYRAAKSGLLGHEDPFTSDYAERVFGIDGRHATTATIGDYLRANPHLFGLHILANLRDRHTLISVFAVILLAMIPWITPRYRSLRPASLYLLLVCLPVIAAMIVIYPRTHYPVIVAPALLAFALQLLPAPKQPFVPPIWLLLAIGYIAAHTVAAHPAFFRSEFDTNVRGNITTIASIRELERSVGAGNGKLFDTHTVAFDDVYFLLPHTRIHESSGPSWASFTQLIRQQRPSWVIDGPAMPILYGHSHAEIAHFLHDEMGYTAHPCPPETGVVIYTLIPKSNARSDRSPHP